MALLAGLQDDVNLARCVVPNPNLLTAPLRKIASVVGTSTVDIRGIGRTPKKDTNKCKRGKKRRQPTVRAHGTSPL
jgi:hypothetical protein